MKTSFSRRDRTTALERAAETVVDVAIVGGGITGAGVAREAALRGLVTVVLDKGDFACGTSSRSSKLIHGGIRYLAQGDIGLVREAARERAVLRRLAPHLARPLSVLVPVASLGGRVKMTAAMWSFERLAGEEAAGSHEVLDTGEALAAEPGMRRERTNAAIRYTEYLTDDARLTLETVKSAAAVGAWAASYAEVVAIDEDPAGLMLTVRDRMGDATLGIRCRCLVNAAGPWFDRVRCLQNGNDGELLQLTRGIHVVVPRERLPISHVVILRSPDGRSTFAAPQGAVTYIGTTDTHYEGQPEEPGVAEQDVDYLLESAADIFNEPPQASDIIGTWSGVRPLLRQAGKKPSEISRRDEIMVGPGPVVAVAGGKLTTYRRMSERVVASVFEVLGRSQEVEVDSSRLPLCGGDGEQQKQARSVSPRLRDRDLEERLWQTYGVAAAELVRRIDAEPAAAERLADLANLTVAELDFMVDHELVLTLDDLLRRRCRVAIFDSEAALAAAPGAARALGARLGWSAAVEHEQIEGLTGLVRDDLGVARAATR